MDRSRTGAQLVAAASLCILVLGAPPAVGEVRRRCRLGVASCCQASGTVGDGACFSANLCLSLAPHRVAAVVATAGAPAAAVILQLPRGPCPRGRAARRLSQLHLHQPVPVAGAGLLRPIRWCADILGNAGAVLAACNPAVQLCHQPSLPLPWSCRQGCCARSWPAGSEV